MVSIVSRRFLQSAAIWDDLLYVVWSAALLIKGSFSWDALDAHVSPQDVPTLLISTSVAAYLICIAIACVASEQFSGVAMQQVMQAQGHQDSLAAQVAQMRAAAKTFAAAPSQPRALHSYHWHVHAVHSLGYSHRPDSLTSMPH